MVGPIIQLAFGSWRLFGTLCYRPGAQCPRLKSLSPALTVLAGYQAAHTLMALGVCEWWRGCGVSLWFMLLM